MAQAGKTYIINIKTFNVSLRFSIVSDSKIDALSQVQYKGDLALFEIYEKIMPAVVRRGWYIMAGFINDELRSAQSYCEGDSETADDVISLFVKEALQDVHHDM